ncbi:MAG: response regulator, partial [Psychrosphaera sp.]|nr:response regulator [Psychrosphaera sp.]
GLALVKELVVAHQGSIVVQSQRGRGCTFVVSLPLCEPPQSVLPTELATALPTVLSTVPAMITPHGDQLDQQSSDDRCDKQGLLIVEDNRDMCRYLLDCFSADFNCVTAYNGEQGLEIAISQVPDIVISDVMMPIMDGYQLAEKLRNNDKTSHIPIVLLTAKGDRQSRIKGWQTLVDDYVAKPFDIQELRVRVDSLLLIRTQLRRQWGAVLSQRSPTFLASTSTSTSTVIDGMSPLDVKFVEKFEQCISEHYSQSELSRTMVAGLLFMTDRQLNRKLNALFEHNFSQYLRQFRLRQSTQMLLVGTLPIVAVSEAIGFGSSTYFARCFKAEFGVSPSEYALQGPKKEELPEAAL